MMYRSKRLIFIVVAQLFLVLNLSAQENSSACACCGEEYQQFNFWLGDWVVYSKGKMVAFNKITKIEDGCIVRENWKSVGSNYSGTSYNFYDKVSGKWKQTWVDNQGSVLELSGAIEDNKMILQSKVKIDDAGNRVVNRLTWTNNKNGTVNQMWEASEDGGVTFVVVFDGLYRKRKLP